MKPRLSIVSAALVLAGCSSAASSYPPASPAFTPQADCERTGGWWHPDMNYCEYEAPPPPRFPPR